MAQWLQAQLNVAHNLLESVDRTIYKTVGMNAESDPGAQEAAHGVPFGEASSAQGPVESAAGLHSLLPPSDARLPPAQSLHATPPVDPQLHSTTYTIRQRGPFDSPSPSTPAPPAAAPALPTSVSPSAGYMALFPNPSTASPSAPPHQGSSAEFLATAVPHQGVSPEFLAASTPHHADAGSGYPAAATSQTVDQPGSSSHAAVPLGSYMGTTGPLPLSLPTQAVAGAAAPAPAPVLGSVKRADDPAPAAATASSALPVAAGARAVAGPTPTESVAAPAAAATGARAPLAPARAPVEPTPPAAGSGGATVPGTGSNGSGVSAGAAKLVEQLRKRLEVAQAENEQLEEMLKREEKRAADEAAAASKLAEELSTLQDARAQSEALLQSQLAAQQLSSRELGARLEVSTRQVLKLEAEVEGLRDTAKQMAETRSGLEGGMLEALKVQLEAAEQRLDVERRAHQLTKAAAMARETELEGLLSSSAQGLAGMQRALDEAGTKGRDLEDQVALLQSACQQLEQQRLQGSGSGSGSVGPSGLRGGADAADAALLDALRADLSQQQRACQASDQARAAAEAQLKQLRLEAEALRAQVEEHAARGDMAQLEARVREVSDMLFLKQNQLERLSADKAAQQLRLEGELHQARQEIKCLRQQEGQGGAAAGLRLEGRGSGDEVIPMDALGAPYQRLAQHGRVGKAVKAAANFLDSTASAAVFFLRQYPLARLIIFAYLLFIHLYIYYLMARLQGIAVKMEAMTDLVALGGPNASGGSIIDRKMREH